MIDNYIMDQSPRITMTLSEILANTPPVQTLAQATDVPGTNLEWMKTAAYLTGAWFGDLGELGTTGFRDSLFTGYLASGVTCKVSGVPYSWGGVARWVTNRRAVLSGVATFNYFPLAGLISGNNAGRTIANKLPAPRRFKGFRIKIPSGDSASVTYTYAFSTNPTDSGSALSWEPITFSGSATITRTGATPIVSDLIVAQISSLAPIYLFIRAYSVSANFGYVDSGAGQYFASTDKIAFGDYSCAWGIATGNFTLSGSVVVGTSDWSAWEILSADFYGDDCFTVGAVGDSLDQGWSVGGGSATESNLRHTARFAAKYLDSIGACAGYNSFAKAGEKHVVSMPKVTQLYSVDTFADFVIMRPWSPNDGPTYSAFAKSRAETIAAISNVSALGGVAVVATPTPCGASGEKEAGRVSAVAFAMSAAHGGVGVDIATPVADPANEANIAPAYMDTTGNSTHMSTAGYALVGYVYGQQIALMI